MGAPSNQPLRQAQDRHCVSDVHYYPTDPICKEQSPVGWGFAPTRRGPFVSAKGPKTIGARAWPSSGAFAPVPFAWAPELASLRQSSPPHRFRDRGAATPAGTGKIPLPPVVLPDPSLRSGQAKEENSYPNKDSCSGFDCRVRPAMTVVSLRLSSNSRRNREGSRSLRSPNRNRLRQWSRDTRSLARVRPT